MALAPASAEAARPAARERALERVAPSLPLFATLAIVAVFLLAATPSFIVPDTWLALMAGREIVNHGLPIHDHLTLLTAGRRWVDQQWLGQLLVYGLSCVGGVKAVVLTGWAAALSAWALAIGAAGRRAPPRPGAVTVLVVAGVLSSPWALQVRTQEFALPLYATVLWLLLADPLLVRRRTLLVLPVLVVWANVHGSVALGVAIVGAYALAAVRAAPRRRLWPYLAVPLTLFASPYAGGLAGYYRLMLIFPAFRRFIFEWQPSRPSVLTALFYLLAASTAVVVVRRRHAYHLGELVILAGTCVCAVWAIRNIVWFVLAAAAILPVRGRGDTFRTSGAGVFALAAACVIPISAGLALAKPPAYWQGRVSAATARALRPLVLSTPGPVFADDSHADWLLWQFPQLRGRVLYDDRAELLTARQMRLLQNSLYGHGGVLGACLAVVDPGRGTTHQLPGRLVWRDSTTAVLVEDSPRCRTLRNR